MTEQTVTREFSLGSGEVYIAGGSVPQSELEAKGIRAGVTDGGCVLSCEYRVKELYDTDGRTAAVIKYGEKARVKGRLCRISPEALPLIVSGDRGTGGTGEVSVLLICPLTGDESFRLYLRGGIPTGTVISAADGGGLDFELMCGGDLSDVTLRLGETLAGSAGGQ